MISRTLFRAFRLGSRILLPGRKVSVIGGLTRPFMFSTARDNTVKQNAETKQFKTETKKLLDIVAKSLYTDKEVFLRQLLSNASDALQKQRFKTLSSEGLEIQVNASETKKTVTIEDNGIGMSKEELMDHLGTIAKSGSKEFVEAIEKDKSKGTPENIIGQFGVGFYSSFIVADYVEVISKKDKNSKAYIWSSDGSGKYEIAETTEPGFDRGTRIVLHLKGDGDKFWNSQEVKKIVEKYSNFINYPIKVNGESLNTVKAIWARDRRELTNEDYNKFFEYLTGNNQDYYSKIHYSADVPISIKSLIYIPKAHKQKYGLGQETHEVSLYSRKVLIKKNCKELLPSFLRFLKGVVDCEDIPLNISRQTYQDSALMGRLRNVITKRVLRHIKEEADKNPIAYNKWFQQFQLFIKQGLIDQEFRQEAIELNRFECNMSENMIDLKTYMSMMKPNQDKIFYLYVSQKSEAKNSPYLEPYIKAGLPVLFINIHIDEIVFREMGQYQGKNFVNIETDEQDLSKYLGEVKHDESKGIKAEDLTTFPIWIKNQLQPFVSKVVVSKKNISSPAMVISQFSSSMRQMRMMKEILEQRDKNSAVREDLKNLTFEINPNHPMMAQLNAIRTKNPDLASIVIRQLFNNCCIEAGLEPNVKDNIERVNNLLVMLMRGDSQKQDSDAHRQ